LTHYSIHCWDVAHLADVSPHFPADAEDSLADDSHSETVPVAVVPAPAAAALSAHALQH
jgi:hypothetical protein